MKKKKTYDIIAWDGEGVTNEETGEHRYIMLCNSKRLSLEADSIGTKAALDFFIDNAGGKNALHVSYGFNYDVTMVMRELSNMREQIPTHPFGSATGKQIIGGIWDNRSQEGVRFKLEGVWYEVFYRPRKEVVFRRYRSARIWAKDAKGKRFRDCESIRIWDVLGFSQSPFVDALREYKIAAPEDFIADMKTKRSNFQDQDREEMRRYCFDECDALVALYRAQLDAFAAADLMPSRHDGPGALAATLLRKNGVKEHLVLEPEPMRDPIARAYFGGRIEMLQVGHAEGIYGYDVASAYPAAAVCLPSLLGEWRRLVLSPNRPETSKGVYRVEYRFPRGLNWYPLPYRCKKGIIRFADTGEGWYWGDELAAARAFVNRMGGEVVVLDGYVLDDWGERPFGMIAGVYEQRQVWKRDKNGAEKALKLALNSLYGKTAQQLGGSLDKMPPYFSLVWAGMITAATRARLVLAALTNPESVIAFATDGIFTTAPLPIDTPKDAFGKPTLGAWEGPDYYEAGVFVQAGVYWLKKGEEWKPKFRGFDRAALMTPEPILQAWRDDVKEIPVNVTRFQSYRSSLASASQWRNRCRWFCSPRMLRLDGGSAKRREISRITGLHMVAPRVNEWYEATRDTSYPHDSITLGAHIDEKDENMVQDSEDTFYS